MIFGGNTTFGTERSGYLTTAGERALCEAERRAEGRRQRAEYWAEFQMEGRGSFAAQNARVRAHRAALRAPVDLLAQRAELRGVGEARTVEPVRALMVSR